FGNFGVYPNTFELTFFPAAAALKSQQILVIKVFLDFVEVRFQGNRALDSEVVRFGSGLFRKLAEISLSVEHPEVSAADVPAARIIKGPDIDILFLRAFDGGLQVRVKRVKTSTKIVDARGDQDDRAAVAAGARPAFQPILQGKIR